MTVRKTSIFLVIICFLASVSFPSPIQATEVSESESSPDDSFINSVEADITGDGLREYIRLEGKLLSDNSMYYHDVWLDIASPFSKTWNITLKGGYHPKIALFDINHNQVVDIFYEVALNEEKTEFASSFYTLHKGKVEQLDLPEKNYIKGEYIDDFQIALTLHPNKPPIHVPVSNQSLAIEQNLYDTDGKVLKEVSTQIEPIHQYEPTLISESKGYGLKTIQQVKDITNNEIIGSVETLWYMHKKNWLILQNRWHKPSKT